MPLAGATATESRLEMEDVVVQRVELKLPREAVVEWRPPQSLVHRNDDWFLMLDVAPRETSYVLPGTFGLKAPVCLKIFRKST